jgi:hypothetical protein
MLTPQERFAAMLIAMVGDEELKEMKVTFEDDDDYHYLLASAGTFDFWDNDLDAQYEEER